MNMTASQTSRVQTPWYKERWTWLLMIMPATAIVAGFITLWLAIKSFDGLVADDYYKQGLAINQTLARANVAQERGLVAQVKLTSEDIGVVLGSKSGKDLPEKLVVTLAHPTKGGLDQQITLELRNGVFRGNLRAPLVSARWKVLLEDESRNWRLSGAAFLPTETEIRIDSADLKPVD